MTFFYLIALLCWYWSLDSYRRRDLGVSRKWKTFHAGFTLCLFLFWAGSVYRSIGAIRFWDEFTEYISAPVGTLPQWYVTGSWFFYNWVGCVMMWKTHDLARLSPRGLSIKAWLAPSAVLGASEFFIGINRTCPAASISQHAFFVPLSALAAGVPYVLLMRFYSTEETEKAFGNHAMHMDGNCAALHSRQ